MGSPADSSATRVDRERQTYRADGVFAVNSAWRAKAPHVFDCPNTRYAESEFFDRLARAVPGRRVLEIGCGHGWACRKVHEMGARTVLGVDVSESLLEIARPNAVPGELEFRNADASAPMAGRFDVIFALGVLHHLDYRPVLRQLYERNLAGGGVMLFVEPLGENWLLRVYRAVAVGAHTPDERPFFSGDLAWLRRTFPQVQLLGRNWASFPAGILSSRLFASADNPLTRLADRLDRDLAGRFPALVERYRQVNIAIAKPPKP